MHKQSLLCTCISVLSSDSSRWQRLHLSQFKKRWQGGCWVQEPGTQRRDRGCKHPFGVDQNPKDRARLWGPRSHGHAPRTSKRTKHDTWGKDPVEEEESAKETERVGREAGECHVTELREVNNLSEVRGQPGLGL